MKYLLEVLRHHHQKSCKSCAASGMEIICKCHELIPLNDFRFQEQFGDTNIGFEHAKLLSPLGIEAKTRSLSITDCLDLLETETTQGRFPLVSLPVKLEVPYLHCHVFLCGKDKNELALFDPANGKLRFASREVLENHMNSLLRQIPNRPHIDVLVYSIANSQNHNCKQTEIANG